MRIIYNQTNFTAGEVSPRLQGRVDIDRYANGVEIMENALPLIHGGCTNRYGSLYIAAAKNANKKAKLIPFIYSTSQAYVIELGDLYMRIFTSSAQVLSAPLTPFEVSAPYTEAQLATLDYVQSADTLFLFHEAQPIYRIRRFADANWDVTAAPFSVAPYAEWGDNFATSLTLSLATVGNARTVTASAATFLSTDVGRSITYLGGTLKITVFTDTTNVTGDISTAFGSTAIPVSVWTLTGSPQTSVTPSAKDPVGTNITLTAAANAWRNTDVNKLVQINGGTVQIVSFTSALVVNGVILQVLTGTVAAPTNSWALLAAVWNATRGYPRTGTLYQQRLFAGGTTVQPNTIWACVIGQTDNFTEGVNDSDAFSFPLSSDQFNPIQHLVSTSNLIALTSGSEFSIRGGIEKAITPINKQVDSETSYGSAQPRPLRIGREILLVQRAGYKIRAMSYRAIDDSYDSSDLTALSEHITQPGIADLSYAQEPDPIVYALRSDGVMPQMTFSREQNVIAWCRTVMDGQIESIASIPIAGRDQTWLLVKRTLPSGVVRYIEILNSGTLMDCAITGTSGPGATIWAGLTHLEGKTVACLADGADMGNFTVAAGQITLPRKAFAVSIGLPFTSTIKLLTPEVQTGTGSAQGQAMSTSDVLVRVLDTQSLKINGKVVPLRQLDNALLDQAPPAFTGFKKLTTLGWDKGRSDITITNDRPMKFHILAVVRTFTVNSGGAV